MALQAQEWTINGLSVELAIDRRTLGKRLSGLQPFREDGRYKYYLMADVHKHLSAAKGSGEERTIEEEKRRLTTAQADKTELEVETMRGTLIPADQVESVWMNMVSAFRAKILSIPHKLAPQAIACANVADAEQVLRAGVYEALTELSAYDSRQYGNLRNPEEGSGDNSAAARTDSKRMGGSVPAAE